jgi:hypothetical protein
MKFRRENWDVRACDIRTARALVEKYHYAAGASNTATYLHGLYEKCSDKAVGVAWWIPPTKAAANAAFPENWKGVLSLSRLVVHPDVPKNAASFLIAGSMRQIDRGRWPCLLTYADTWRGHTGAIYRATNWSYTGLTTPEATWVLNGRMVARKAGGKTRTKAEMEELGAVMIGRFAKHRYVSVLTSDKKGIFG